MKPDNCTCTTTTEICRSTAGERPRYFPRQLVTAEDLMLEQEYFRNRLRLHNRLLHGWGVVCGLQVAPVEKRDGKGGLEPWIVRVCPGHALGPYGDDITVPCNVDIDLREDSVSGSSVEPCGATGDIWCSDIWLDRSRDSRLYLAIRYAEVPTRPLRVQPAGCGCDDTACEFSRLRDGYEIKVLTAAEFRPLALDLSKLPDWRELFKLKLSSPIHDVDPNPACWPCPEQPWVALACVQIDSNGKILMIDNCGSRRLVAALGCFYWSCANIEITSILGNNSPPEFWCGKSNQTPITLARDVLNTITIMGHGFQDKASVGLGSGIMVEETTVTSLNSVTVSARVEATAAEGPRDLVLVNPDCSTAFCAGAINVPPVTKPVPGVTGQPVPGRQLVAEQVEEDKPKPRRRRR